VCNEVNPDDPDGAKTDDPRPNSTFYPRYTTLVSIVDDDDSELFTAKKRAQWAKGICSVNNSPQVQQLYPRGSSMLVYSGDLTPPADQPQFPLSRFLTTFDTLDIMTMVYATEDGEKASMAELIGYDDILSKYFYPNQIPAVKEKYGFPEVSSTTERNEDTFYFIPTFKLNSK
jgi:hypothetical protein